ncbi:hypothetical protein V8D89_002748 [Ganoderma adspersum]
MTLPDEQPSGRRRFVPSQYASLPTCDGARQTHSLLLTLRSKRARYAVAVGAIMVSILVLSQIFLGPHTWRPSPHDIPPFPPPMHNLHPPHEHLPGDVDWSRFAYSQYATNSAYLCNTVMIFEALHRLGAKADRLLMYPSAMVPDPAGDSNGRLLAKAREVYGVHLVPIAVQHRGGGDPTWSDSYTKLLAFNQTQYARVLALDSDATLLQPMDELFLLPPAPAALPRAYWLHDPIPVLTTALLLATPSHTEFQRVTDAIASARGGEFDMEIVNRLYGRNAIILPHRRYALLTGEFRIVDPRGHAAYLGNEYEEWDPDAALREAKFLHFSDWPMPKPWLDAAAATVQGVQPKCVEGPRGRKDCRSREMWLGFYADFKMRRADICGGMMVTPTHPRIAIIGGGPAGLTLLITLHRRGIPATVYEREPSIDSRAHLGGMLDLGHDSGQRALRENGLGEIFAQNSRPEADAFRICDPEGNILASKDAEQNVNPLDVRPEIDRVVLRKIMVDAAPPDSIKWGYALSSVRDLGIGGEHELTFANGHTTTVDILVGADGANSRVRPLVSPATLIYHGVTGAEISLLPEVAKRPELADVVALVGAGSMYAMGRGQTMGAQLNGDGRIRGYALFHATEDWSLPTDPAAARSALLAKFEGWAPAMRKIIEHCDGGAIYLRPLYRLPVGHTWAHVGGVTLVGDAAHLMSPFAGAGVNLAMLDALELGIVLADAINGGKSVEAREAAVAKCEQERLEAAKEFAEIAKANLEASLSPDAPGSSIKVMSGFFEAPERRRRA